jgi:hypothetical protein
MCLARCAEFITTMQIELQICANLFFLFNLCIHEIVDDERTQQLWQQFLAEREED